MMSRLTISMNFASWSNGGDDKQAGQEVPECPYSDIHDNNEHKKPLSEANKQKEEDEVAMVPPVSHALVASSLALVASSLPPTCSLDWNSVRQSP